MFKRFLALFLTAVLALSVVPALAGELEGELTIWVRTNETGLESLYGNQPGDPYYDYLKEQFPNLKLNFVINKGWGDIAGAAAAGDAPDIFFIDGNPDLLLPQLLNQGLMEPLNAYMEADASFVNNFVPGVLDALTSGAGLGGFFVWKALILAVLLFIGQRKLKWSPVIFIAISAVVGIVFRF